MKQNDEKYFVHFNVLNLFSQIYCEEYTDWNICD